MKSPDPVEPRAESKATGLPGFRTWTKVYLFVLGSFALWVGLLIALTLTFS